jgi:hypothetical protein
MSEGIQGKKDREQLEQQIKIESEGSSSGTAHRLQTTDSSSSSIRASKPQVGALLVEAYGKIVPKQRGFSADKVLFEYAKFLVSPINHFIFKRLARGITLTVKYSFVLLLTTVFFVLL